MGRWVWVEDDDRTNATPVASRPIFFSPRWLFIGLDLARGPDVSVYSDPWRELSRGLRAALDRFGTMLRRCEDGLAQLLRPILAALRRPTWSADRDGTPLYNQATEWTFHRPRPREVIHRRGVFNFHKVKT